MSMFGLKKDFNEDLKEIIGVVPTVVKFKKLDDRAVIPTYAHDGDVGMDLTAIDVEYDERMDAYIYHTGLSVESPYRKGILLFPRSSNRKTDCYLTNHVGVVDSAIYRGELILTYKARISTYERANIIYLKTFVKSLVETNDIGKAEKEAIEAKNRVYEMTKNLEFAPYKVGDRVGQMVVIPRSVIKLVEEEKLSETERGEGGHGSTGN